MTTGSLNLPEDRTPSVLNREAIWKTVKRSTGLLLDTGADQSVAEHELDQKLTDEDRDYITRTTKTLRLEFKQILKIDNLDNLTSLTRLFLDNNFIERISGLDALVHLVWLDLSFNRIRRIEGWSPLTRMKLFWQIHIS
jgi:Leucine-rich repeat (LRR) protein